MKEFKKKVFNVIQIGSKDDKISRLFDVFIVITIVLNLFVTLFDTFDEFYSLYGVFDVIELITIIIFTIEYVLRLWTAEYLYPELKRPIAVIKFIFSFYGIIDLFTLLPFYLPVMFPAGAVAFRILRVIRIFKLFKINSRYDAFNVITDVIKEKKNQLLSSIVLILIMMLAASLCMYSLEHEAQPEQFFNAFSGIWWAASTLLTVGYGDIYPVTVAGQIMAIVISFLGVGMVAIPTGIISAGFVEQYTKLKQIENYAEEKELKFITSCIQPSHPWNNKLIKEIVFPPEFLLVMILRSSNVIVPKGDTLLKSGDTLVFAAKHYKEPVEINLKEIIIKDENPWVGNAIKDLDISRQELIVMVERGKSTFIPNGSTVIRTNDKIIMYSRHKEN